MPVFITITFAFNIIVIKYIINPYWFLIIFILWSKKSSDTWLFCLQFLRYFYNLYRFLISLIILSSILLLSILGKCIDFFVLGKGSVLVNRFSNCFKTHFYNRLYLFLLKLILIQWLLGLLFWYIIIKRLFLKKKFIVYWKKKS